jgi:hypothetical protein
MSDTARSYQKLCKVPDDELIAAASTAKNMRALLRAIGIAEYGGNYESMRKRLARLGEVPERFRPVRERSPSGSLVAVSREALESAVAGKRTKAEVLRALGFEPRVALYPELNQRLRDDAVDTSHLVGRAWSRGQRLPRLSIQDVLQRGSNISTSDLRLRLLREGVFAHRCACCGQSEWNGAPIPLELDHIDGDRTNNEIGNLRLLCPNCHAQTDTYRGRNVGRPHGASNIESAEPREPLRPVALRRLASIVGAA